MPDEVIDVDLKELEEKKSREERKANGRFASVIIALILILLAIYHAWVRKTTVLAGLLVPALIMVVYGLWVIFLNRRDKKRKLFMARQIEEGTRRESSAFRINRHDTANDFMDSKNLYFDTTTSSSPLETPEKHKHHRHRHNCKHNKTHQNYKYKKVNNEEFSVPTSRNDSLCSENIKINNIDMDHIYRNPNIYINDCNSKETCKIYKHYHHNHHHHHRKRRREHRRKSNVSQNSNSSSVKTSQEKLYVSRGISKRPSFRQKIFGLNPYREAILVQSDLKYLELPPFLHRTNSAP